MERPTDKEAEHDWVERYLNGQMTADERAVVEAERQADPAFDTDVNLLKRTHDLMKEAFLEQQAIDTIRQLQVRDRRRTQQLRVITRSLGSVVALAAMLVLYMSFSPITVPDSENDLSVTRSLADDTTATVQKRVFGQFFDGQAHLTEGQYALAVKNFEQVLTATDIRPYFREAAQWHLAVAYLKSGQPDKAERLYNQFTSCVDCEYSVNAIDRWKVWWRIKLAQWLD
ncbi:hypothetical protein BN8_01547 [Fibrisoma limi BUZ 3]|uniref:Tetratricopeptide repeat protein n=1 Tax=Fibrisoma limi BUZ 3 TaxID=1185876 RepID=I2GF63_9BACT|nr:tetratricopeptide repeat protein [Fibrisoma limi]CCH52538.1 hypothetical protein BN8_01547 [Fibrisoma limi BUZ 3]